MDRPPKKPIIAGGLSASYQRDEQQLPAASDKTMRFPHPLPASVFILAILDTKVLRAKVTSADLIGFDKNPPDVQALIEQALALSRLNLKYTVGSADPAKGGMDCSGTIHHLPIAHGLRNVPRQENTIYTWVWKEGRSHAVVSPRLNSFEFAHLRPGDRLFWSGPYQAKNDPPFTHVMLYLGKLKSNQRPIMFGASEDRRLAGKTRNGVTLFDFVIPKPESPSRFPGYASIPGLIPPPAVAKAPAALPVNPPPATP